MNNLSLCWGSLDGVDFGGFLTAAANAGFGAVTLNTALYLEVKSAGLSDRDFTLSIADHGLSVSDIDPLFNWLPGAVTLTGSDAISVCTRASIEDVFQLAHLVGTDLVNAPLGLASPDSEQQIVDCFAVLCERARQEQLRVSLEFMPFNQVSDLATAARIVKQAGCDNGGIMFDCWHHHRGGGAPQDILAVPGAYFYAVQLDDALATPMGDMMEETMNHRLLPGEGCIDLVQILRNLEAIGAEVIYDIEVFNEPMRALSAADRARQIYDSTHAVMAQV